MRAAATEWAPALAAAPDLRTAMPSIRALFDAHFDFIWRSVRRLGLTNAEADDATQSVFIVASRKLESIVPGKERAFLFGIATRVVADVRKGAARRLERSLDQDFTEHATGADALLDQARARACLEMAVLAMPMDLRTVFVLFELEELTMAEIADVVGIPPGTVASRIRRARDEFEAAMRKLRARFGGAR
jgi:RNA polymerase sigma-70 factor (ECF subfamily)